MIYTTKLSSKGQVVLPKSVRISRGWKPGTELVVRERDNGVLLEPKRTKRGSMDRLFGVLPYSGRPKTLKQMDDAITAEARLRK